MPPVRAVDSACRLSTRLFASHGSLAQRLLEHWREMMPALVSSMQVEWYRHDRLANNLANVSTAGFKQDELSLVHGGVPPEPAAGFAGGLLPVGVHAMAAWTDFSQGAIRETGRPLDLALNGSGFFVVQTPRGPRYTRSGAFNVGQDGYLATADGSKVLGQNGPIALRSSEVTVTDQGEVQEGDRVVDTLRVVDFSKPYRLVKEADGLFVPAAPGVAPEPAQGHQVVGGALEDSNVNAVRTMVNMIELLRRYETGQRAIQAVDEADRYTANDMGRV